MAGSGGPGVRLARGNQGRWAWTPPAGGRSRPQPRAAPRAPAAPNPPTGLPAHRVPDRRVPRLPPVGAVEQLDLSATIDHRRPFDDRTLPGLIREQEVGRTSGERAAVIRQALRPDVRQAPDGVVVALPREPPVPG